MTSIGRAPLFGAILSPEPASGRFLLAAAAASLFWMGSMGAASAEPWVMDFENEVTIGDNQLTHGERVDNKWRTVALPGADNLNVMISTYDRSSTGLPPGMDPTNPATMPSFTTGSGAVSSSYRKATIFDTATKNTPDPDMQTHGTNGANPNHFRYGNSTVVDGKIDNLPSSVTSGKYNPGNVLVMDNTSNSGTETHDDGGLFVFQFSAPVTLSSLDVFDQSYNQS